MGTIEPNQVISKICFACGMCCDGTLFDMASIIDKDDRALADSLSLSTIAENGELWFHQPCCHFIHKCTIYGQDRPKICSRYFCRPIRELKKNKITLQEVRDLIFKTVRLKQQFENHSISFPEFSDKSIYQIRKLLNIKNPSPDEQISFRRQYSMLLLIGTKLFPLLDQISNTNKKTTSQINR